MNNTLDISTNEDNLPILPKGLVRGLIAIAIVSVFVFFKSSIQVFLILGIFIVYLLFFFQIVNPFIRRSRIKWSQKKYKVLSLISNLFSVLPLVILIIYALLDLLHYIVIF